ncbi:MAG: hypothetical protein JOZ85_12070 [Betaproteobacteria bacterium]|nr:hypothetical protein [Betaproteobacteria bacterium]
MSAAATAAGYLYASGRLRGRTQRDQEEGHNHPAEQRERQKPAARQLRVDRPRREVRVAALPPEEVVREKPRRTPTIQYRTRRWKPGEEPSE